MSKFPTTPNNGDIFVRDSIPYIYNSTDNKWNITTDANLISGNIYNGKSILGVNGTLTHIPDANLISGNIKSGVSIFGVSGNITQQPTINGNITASSTITRNSGGDNWTIKYYSLGKLKLLISITNGSTNPQPIASGNGNKLSETITELENFFGTIVGSISDGNSGTGAHGRFFDGSDWLDGGGIISAIQVS